MTIKANVLARLSAEQTGTNALGAARHAPMVAKALTLLDGTGVDQVDRVYARQHVIASAGTLDLDLAGGVIDDLGNTVTFAELVAILIVNEAADGTVNTTAVTVGGGSNPFVGFWGAAGDQIVLQPGQMFQTACGSAAGIGTVVPATGDILRLSNASGAAATVQIIILGRSA